MIVTRFKYLTLALAVLLATLAMQAEAKRFGSVGRSFSRSRGSSSSKPSWHSSRSSSVSHSSSSKPSWHSSSSSSVSLSSSPSKSHFNWQSLNSNPVNTHTNRQPIGWNVPKAQGPPPAYSAHNPIGGAKTNIHEPAPAYKASAPPPNYAAATNTGYARGTGMGAAPASALHQPYTYTGASVYRPLYHSRSNSTGGFGSGYHTPITATNSGGLQSNYPRQQFPAGTIFHTPGALPTGATYHSSMPAGATYHSPGAYPAGASYYPAAAAIPAGATYLPAGAALPTGATYYPQTPKSSGPGLGTGLIAGALGGAILGHALTPTHTRVVEQSGGGGGGYGGGGNGGSGDDDKIIIINNGPPGSVTTTDAGSGTTVINTGVDTSVPQVPLAPMAPINPVQNVQPNDGVAQLAPFDTTQQPPAGGIICVPVLVPEPDPADSSKTIDVEKIACYPAPTPTEPSTAEIDLAANNFNQAVTAVPSAVTSYTSPPPSSYYDETAVRYTARMSESSGIHVSSATKISFPITATTLLTLTVAFILHGNIRTYIL